MSTTMPAPANEYVLLRKRIVDEKLLDRHPLPFIVKISILGFLLVVAIGALFIVENPFLVVLAAIFLAFVFGQIGIVGHDAGHRQIFRRSWKDAVVGYTASFILGSSYGRWVEKHNEHHAHPNHDDMDPDIDFPMLAFSENQAREKRGIFRWIVRHQAILFFPMLCFAGASLKVDSVAYFFRIGLRKSWLDILLYVTHYALYFFVVFWTLSLLNGIIFIVLHQMCYGLYLGLIFAPNHKGMPIIEKDVQMDFVREQVLTTRNIYPNLFTNIWYGGLHFQIEHHLFPTLPSRSLGKAQKIVKEFCAERQIPYHETGVFQSYWEILKHMHHVGSFCA